MTLLEALAWTFGGALALLAVALLIAKGMSGVDEWRHRRRLLRGPKIVVGGRAFTILGTPTLTLDLAWSFKGVVRGSWEDAVHFKTLLQGFKVDSVTFATASASFSGRGWLERLELSLLEDAADEVRFYVELQGEGGLDRV